MTNNDKESNSKEESNSNRPSFIKIAPGAKIDGLLMKQNIFIGDADVINNKGELKNARFDSNTQITQNRNIPNFGIIAGRDIKAGGNIIVSKQTPKTIPRFKKYLEEVIIGIVITVIGGALLYSLFGIK